MASSPFSNITSDTSPVFLHKGRYAANGGLFGPNEPDQVDSMPTVQPLRFGGDQSPEGEPHSQINRLASPAPPSILPPPARSCLAAANAATLGPCCSHWKAAQGRSGRKAPHVIPGPPLSHAPMLTQGHPGVHGLPLQQVGARVAGVGGGSEDMLPQPSCPRSQGTELPGSFSMRLHAPSGSSFFPSAPWKPS